jgi:hypothetical protein
MSIGEAAGQPHPDGGDPTVTPDGAVVGALRELNSS